MGADRSGLRFEFSGDQSEEGCLAAAVDAYESMPAVAEMDGYTVEEGNG